jgi:hypothetical protein
MKTCVCSLLRISSPIEINPDQQKQNLNRSIGTRFPFLRKKHPENQQAENSNKKLTLTQRFNSLRSSFRIGNRDSSNKGQRYLLSNE